MLKTRHISFVISCILTIVCVIALLTYTTEDTLTLVNAQSPVVVYRDVSAEDCTWVFSRYIPSAYELEWLSNIQQWQHSVCDHMRLVEQLAKSERWLEYTRLFNSREHQLLNLTLVEQVLSRFEYQRRCDGAERTVYIEPLAGLTRHPRFCTEGSHQVVNKDYMLLDYSVQAQLRDAAGGEAFYFDAGASSYNAGAGGASQAWIVDSYRDRGVNFSDVLAWEYTLMNPVEVLQQVPASVKPHYHWYNVPVTAEPSHPDNPLTNMLALCRELDLVVFKLDIDTPGVEEALVYSLLNRTSAETNQVLRLIDDMYFEHHVNVREMHPYWGAEMHATLSASYELFSALRHHGVRAHSWV